MRTGLILGLAVMAACSREQPSEDRGAFEYAKTIVDLDHQATNESWQLLAAWKRYHVAGVRSITGWRRDEGDAQMLTVDLLDEAQRKVGEAEIEHGDSEQGAVVLRMDGIHVRVGIDNTTGVVSLDDYVTRQHGLITPDETTRTFRRDTAAEGILKARGDELLVVAMGLYSDVVQTPQQEQDEHIEGCQASSNGTSASPLVSCTGGERYGRTTAAVLSYCCKDAQFKVADLCTNSACLGCCQYWGCDSWCGAGSYYCICGMLGEACAAY